MVYFILIREECILYQLDLLIDQEALEAYLVWKRREGMGSKLFVG